MDTDGRMGMMGVMGVMGEERHKTQEKRAWGKSGSASPST
jgi:hypothetical protein